MRSSITPRASRYGLPSSRGWRSAWGRRRSSSAPPTISTHRPRKRTTASTSPTSTRSVRASIDDDAGPERRRPDVPGGLEDGQVPAERALRAQGRPQPGRHGRHGLPRPLRRSDPQRRTAPAPRTTSSGAPSAATRPPTSGAATVVASRADDPLQARASAPRRCGGGGSAFAGIRDDPFFFDLPGFVEFKEELLGGTTNLGSCSAASPARHVRGDQRPLDRAQASRTPSSAAPATRSACGRPTSVRRTAAGRQVDRMGRPAINTVFNGLLLPSDSDYNGLEKDAFNFQRPSKDRATTTDNVETVLNAIGNVLTTNARHGLHGRRGVGDRRRPAAGRAHDHARLAAPASRRARRSRRSPSTAASWVTTSSTPSSPC